MSHPHHTTGLCAPGRKLYASALRSGRISHEATATAPCLFDLDLLRLEPGDTQWLVPTPPTQALAGLVEPLERELGEYRRFVSVLADTVEKLTSPGPDDPATAGFTVWTGKERIDAALARALEDCTEQFLAIQPASGRTNWNPATMRTTAHRVRRMSERGVTQRTLYNHTYRHHPSQLAYLDELSDTGLEVRTLEVMPERLLIVDRDIAFVPAQASREVAMEIRHPGLVWFLRAIFDYFWELGVPWGHQPPEHDTREGITGVQRSIARLLVEGYLDEAIARRLGMNVRTCRAHIAKLSTALGSDSRTQLGYLISRSGMLDRV
ncbi:helix-turn-helix transcriptional regulator [Streptomyces sp. CMB-StM0423]|uniref:helix-turn-helix transcriptional regulator n=1 Tax=Streptomyces sp. CMB-StM0423 TaxID=2059884 RepID=UPI000C6FF413|nr:helix-turn-helix transcriptional regulator [Streptomyces sp. CMB-StM0423]AUH41617.1 helix-turn-helix transcriptional regulator [Streptomyces sp. CMB-StM0423]